MDFSLMVEDDYVEVIFKGLTLLLSDVEKVNNRGDLTLLVANCSSKILVNALNEVMEPSLGPPLVSGPYFPGYRGTSYPSPVSPKVTYRASHTVMDLSLKLTQARTT
ncbi:hypothetical protein VNO80_30625 [Phaseolus coccineus]|uniref:Uncharacterized protein n=1 Tax=Phaseolus coccineus TaxID=3886 RepID=A0AAN9QGA4_PHACN